MSIEMTVSEIAEVLGLSRQAINNRVKELPEEDTKKNDKGVTVVTRTTRSAATIDPSSHEGSRNLETRVGPSKRRSPSNQKRLFCSPIWRKIKKLFGLLTNLMASFIIYSLVWVVIEVNNGKIKRLYRL